MRTTDLLAPIALITALFLAQPVTAGEARASTGQRRHQTRKTRPVTLTWTAPDTNTDGSELQDLAGYRIHYGKKSRTYTEVVDIAVDDEDLHCETLDESDDEDDPEERTECSYVLCGLDRENYYFMVTAVNSAGVESNSSNEIRK